MATSETYECIVVGGGPAGLQGALSLSRVGIRALLVDADEGRNAFTDHMHNVVTHDGTAPAEFRGIAREQIAQYGTPMLNALVESVERDDDFVLKLTSGETLRAERILLATGVSDDIDALPEGLAQFWGRDVFHCPFCHGREAGQRVVVIGDMPLMRMPAQMLARIGKTATWLTETHEPEAETIERLRAEGVEWLQGAPQRAIVQEGKLTGLVLADGSELACDSVLTHAPATLSGDLHKRLGVEVEEEPGPFMGNIKVDAFGQTSVPGVWAAGDAAAFKGALMRYNTVTDAIGSAARAAGMIVRDVLD